MVQSRCRKKIYLIALLLILLLLYAQSIIIFRHFGHDPIEQRNLYETDTDIDQYEFTNIVVEGKTPFKTVHLDLKGAPPLLSYLRRILPELAEAGCDSLLIEYEDKFPYNGTLENLTAGNCYNRQQIENLLKWAYDLNMEVIPLIQTFGHLEFVLKLEEWKHLRELPRSARDICPSREGSMELIKEMLRQVMSLHKGIKYIHIGADEVQYLGICKHCIKRKITRRNLYLDHIRKIAEYIHIDYPEVKVIFWDDMIRDSLHLLAADDNNIAKQLVPMVWYYKNDVSRKLSAYSMYWYDKIFNTIWIAGAFKGANQTNHILTNVEKRLTNQISWISFLKKSNIKLIGYVLTGWSRFAHFEQLCELLPAAMPSLLLNLYFVTLTFSNEPFNKQILYNRWRISMQCPNYYNFTPITLNTNPKELLSCHFLGVDFYEIILGLMDFQQIMIALEEAILDYTKMSRLIDSGFINDYLESYFTKATTDIENFNAYTKQILNNYFDQQTCNEWSQQNIDPLFQRLYAVYDKATKNLSRV